MYLITYDQVKDRIIEIRNQKVILDSDVAALYQVETKRVKDVWRQLLFPVGVNYLCRLVKTFSAFLTHAVFSASAFKSI